MWLNWAFVGVSLLGLLGILGVAGLAGFWHAKHFHLSALSFLSYLSYLNFFRFFFTPPQLGTKERPLIFLVSIGAAFVVPAAVIAMKSNPWAGFLGFCGFLGFLGLKIV